MNARLELELGEGAAPADLGDDFLVAALGAFARRHHFGLPALLGGVALVHAEQVAGEQRGLVAAGAGADFQNDVALVHRVLGQERDLDLLLERDAAFLELAFLGIGHGAHFGVGRAVVDQGFEIGDLGNHATVALDRIHDRAELGELARELDESLRRKLGRKLAFHRFVAGEQHVEFLFRKHDRQTCKPWAAANALMRSRIGTLPAGLSISGAISAAALPASSSSSIALTGPTAEGASDSER